MTQEGGCHCGAVRYRLEGEPMHVALCHCNDCRKSAGAPMVSWAMFEEKALTVTQGEPRTRNSSGTAMRSFCPACGTGLFYRNAQMLPGIVDVQSATLDAPETWPAGAQIQIAERLSWMEHAHQLPQFERYPEG
ncbi:MAG: GFA family protein [Sphingobium sp.]